MVEPGLGQGAVHSLTRITPGRVPPAARNPFEKGFLDFPKLLVKHLELKELRGAPMHQFFQLIRIKFFYKVLQMIVNFMKVITAVDHFVDGLIRAPLLYFDAVEGSGNPGTIRTVIAVNKHRHPGGIRDDLQEARKFVFPGEKGIHRQMIVVEGVPFDEPPVLIGSPEVDNGFNSQFF
jgi:hypothetical protein